MSDPFLLRLSACLALMLYVLRGFTWQLSEPRTLVANAATLAFVVVGIDSLWGATKRARAQTPLRTADAARLVLVPILPLSAFFLLFVDPVWFGTGATLALNLIASVTAAFVVLDRALRRDLEESALKTLADGTSQASSRADLPLRFAAVAVGVSAVLCAIHPILNPSREALALSAVKALSSYSGLTRVGTYSRVAGDFSFIVAIIALEGVVAMCILRSRRYWAFAFASLASIATLFTLTRLLVPLGTYALAAVRVTTGTLVFTRVNPAVYCVFASIGIGTALAGIATSRHGSARIGLAMILLITFGIGTTGTLCALALVTATLLMDDAIQEQATTSPARTDVDPDPTEVDR